MILCVLLHIFILSAFYPPLLLSCAHCVLSPLCAVLLSFIICHILILSFLPSRPLVSQFLYTSCFLYQLFLNVFLGSHTYILPPCLSCCLFMYPPIWKEDKLISYLILWINIDYKSWWAHIQDFCLSGFLQVVYMTFISTCACADGI